MCVWKNARVTKWRGGFLFLFLYNFSPYITIRPFFSKDPFTQKVKPRGVCVSPLGQISIGETQGTIILPSLFFYTPWKEKILRSHFSSTGDFLVVFKILEKKYTLVVKMGEKIGGGGGGSGQI